jgi:hypothetical protein
VVIYDQEGKFVGVRRPDSGKPIVVDGVSIVVDELIGSSGLELKVWTFNCIGGFLILLKLFEFA